MRVGLRRRDLEARILVLEAMLQRASVFHRRESGTIAVTAVSTGDDVVIDALLMDRIVDSYRAAAHVDSGAGDSQWSQFLRNLNPDIHEALLARDVGLVAERLSHPAENNLFYGFDNIRVDYTRQCRTNLAASDVYTRQIYDVLARLAEASGAIPLENPEMYGARAPKPYPTEELLRRLDEALGLAIDFPNPYPDEFGLATKRGIASYRAVQSLYQAWRIHQILLENGGTSVVEIGAGLGRTAYYAMRLGVPRYTIVDIPFTLVSSAHFLGHVLGGDRVCLYGEEPAGEPLVLTIPSAFLGVTQTVDLIANFDSFTEIDPAMAHDYWQSIFRASPRFLSINHEANDSRVLDFYRNSSAQYRTSRHPCWMRRGYVEELIEARTQQ
jgi:hypothetical protein